MQESLQTFAMTLLGLMSIALVTSVALLILIVVKIRNIHVPEDAGFAETMLYTPLLVVIFLDVLDFALDFLSAPIAWVVLDRLGLKGLRGIATVESLIPLTQGVPTMTMAWIGARIIGKERIMERKYRVYEG